jgi:glycosyltransferase involved in cell wall biosynthesis
VTPPLVSIVIPTYNRLPVLRQALRSACSQTYPHTEIIVVDDASTDGTATSLASEFDTAQVKVISHSTNKGAGEARNTGVTATRGSYIAFLDSDDSWLPEKLMRQMDALQASPNAVMSFTGVSMQRKNRPHPTMRSPRKTHGTWLESLLYGQGFCSGSTLLVKKTAFQEIGPILPLKRLEDVEWLMRAFRQYDHVALVPEPLVHVQPSGGSASKDVINAIEQVYAQHVRALDNAALQHAFATWRCVETAAYYRRNNDYGALIACILQSILRNPTNIYVFMRRAAQALSSL